MAVGKNTQAVDRITPKQSGGIRVAFSKPGGDETSLSLSAKGNDDYITKKEFNDNVPSGLPPEPTTITAGTTPTPLVVAYNEATYPSYILIRTSDNSFDWNTNVEYDGVNFTVSGADDGSGKFADSYLFVILPTFGGGGGGGGSAVWGSITGSLSSQTDLATALADLVPEQTPATTGTALSFTEDQVYGSIATPETGNITAVLTGAKLGVTVTVLHNNGTAPTFGSEFHALSGSGSYVSGVLNFIDCQYLSNTIIRYSISQ